MRIRVPDSMDKLTGGKPISLPNPVYPALARQEGVQGDVLLHVIIGTDGAAKNISVLSGDPLLIQAAMDAVKQWRYQPTLLGGNPVELDTTITVTFNLEDNPAQQTPIAPPPAGVPPAEASPTVDPQEKVDIVHLFDVMHVQDLQAAAVSTLLNNMRPALLASFPLTPNRNKILDAYFQKVIALTKTGDFLDDEIAVYAEYLSDDDIKALTAFYETPAGQHYNAVTSKIFSESARVGQQNATKNLPRIFRELCDEYPELQGQAKFCPKPATGGRTNEGLLVQPGAAPWDPNADPVASATTVPGRD
ncbi:MAG: TonB family protein [Candidatus Acidiferrales bacterium]